MKVLIISIAILVALILYYIKTNKKYKTSISFKESIDLTNIPVVTFLCNNQKLNFLLDTGSDDSYIASNYEQFVNSFASTEMIGNVAGYNGVTQVKQKRYFVVLGYKNNKYKVSLDAASHLNEAFTHLKQQTGVQIHGILGSKFLEEHKYVLDFKDLIAYQR